MPNRSSNFSGTSLVSLAAPQAARTASFTSNSFDIKNFDSATLVANVGATGDTLNGTNRVELQVQESADNVTFTNAADSSLTKVAVGQAAGTFAVLNSGGSVGQIYRTGYIGSKRYIRVAATNYGTTSNGTFIDVLGIGGRPRQAPFTA